MIVPHRRGQTNQNNVEYHYEKWENLWLYPAEIEAKKKAPKKKPKK